MTRKSISLLVIALGIPLSSCGYRIAIESTDTTTTSTTATTSPPRITPTTVYLGDGCTSSNHAELLKIRGDVSNARRASTDGDGVPTSDEWKAETRAFRDYRSFVRSLDVPSLATEQDALVDAIADFLEAYNRYWESGRQDLSVNNYLTPYEDANYDFWTAFEKSCR